MLFILIFALVLLDQITKHLVANSLTLGQDISVIDGFFDITYERNTGSAFSFLADENWGIYILAAISVIASVLLLFFQIKYRKKLPFLLRLDLAVLTAGTIGNMIDRTVYRSVVDFLKFTFGTYVFPIFNVADICVVVATIGLMLLVLKKQEYFFGEKNSSSKKETEISSGDIEETP